MVHMYVKPNQALDPSWKEIAGGDLCNANLLQGQDLPATFFQTRPLRKPCSKPVLMCARACIYLFLYVYIYIYDVPSSYNVVQCLSRSWHIWGMYLGTTGSR